MRAYIFYNEGLPFDHLYVMRDWLSFDILEELKRTEVDGKIVMYQNEPLTCEKCGFISDEVVYHHILNRNYKSLTHSSLNRIPLCNTCHTGSSEFSAHLTPRVFMQWLTAKRGTEWYEALLDEKRNPLLAEYCKTKCNFLTRR